MTNIVNTSSEPSMGAVAFLRNGKTLIVTYVHGKAVTLTWVHDIDAPLATDITYAPDDCNVWGIKHNSQFKKEWLTRDHSVVDEEAWDVMYFVKPYQAPHVFKPGDKGKTSMACDYIVLCYSPERSEGRVDVATFDSERGWTTSVDCWNADGTPIHRNNPRGNLLRPNKEDSK